MWLNLKYCMQFEIKFEVIIIVMYDCKRNQISNFNAFDDSDG